jgi:hypothetical protein
MSRRLPMRRPVATHVPAAAPKTRLLAAIAKKPSVPISGVSASHRATISGIGTWPDPTNLRAGQLALACQALQHRLRDEGDLSGIDVHAALDKELEKQHSVVDLRKRLVAPRKYLVVLHHAHARWPFSTEHDFLEVRPGERALLGVGQPRIAERERVDIDLIARAEPPVKLR